MDLRAILFLVAASCPSLVQAVAQKEAMASHQNPVRRVVQMLQAMTKKVTAEGEREKELFEKFMCYCKSGTKELADSIDHAETRIPELKSELGAAEGTLKETKEGLKQDTADREAAKEAIAEATGMREKERKEFVAMKDEYVANIQAVIKATAAIEKGMAGAFLQTTQASRVQALVRSDKKMLEEDRQTVLSFLTGNPFSHGYSAESGQIVGILKQMGDSMATALADMTAVEEKSVHSFKELVKAKTDEVDALTDAIETKTAKIGELGLFMVEGQDEMDDLSEGLEEDKKFLKELKKGCETKEAEWEERQKIRAQELLALADTIKILNNDDALELFKKTLPAPGASALLQVSVTSAAMKRRAMSVLRTARGAAPRNNRAKLDSILLSLSSKKADFSKVIQMIDEMQQMLKNEQKEDEEKKDWCNKELDEADDKKKAQEHEMETQTNNIKKANTAIETLTEEMAALVAGIKNLDASVAEATSQRQAENAEYKDLIAADSASKELLEIAKNRLNKFYNPKIYKPEAKEDAGAAAFVQVHSRQEAEGKAAPPPPPETWDAYAKQGQESNGVIAMINMLIKELVVEMTEAETQEKEDQKDYEALMADSAEKRAADSKSLADKEEVKADTEVALEKFKAAQLAAYKELEATEKYIGSLHADCDWLLQFFDVRVEARAGEAKALSDAKAVLSGADYSLVETGVMHSVFKHH